MVYCTALTIGTPQSFPPTFVETELDIDQVSGRCGRTVGTNLNVA